MQNLPNHSNDSLPTQTQSKDLTLAVNRTLQRYGSPEKFLQTFSLDNSDHFTLYPYQCVSNEDTPTLLTLAATFGDTFPIQWLMTMIIGYSEYTGTKVKATPYQVRRLAYNLYTDYKFLKVTDFMLFFKKLEAGYFGKVDYGNFDPVSIHSKMAMYMQYRQEVFAEEERNRPAPTYEGTVPMPPHVKEHLDRLFKQFPTNRQ